MTTEMIANRVIGCAINVHRELGPGLLESAYEQCLQYELEQVGMLVCRQVSLPINYKGLILKQGYRIDLLVQNKLVVELKAVEAIADIHIAQVLTYLKFGEYKLGLILNFNTKLLKNGIRRVIL